MSTDDGKYFLLVIILPFISIFNVAKGLRKATLTHKLLTNGLLGSAVVTHCQQKESTAWNIEIGPIHWSSKPKVKELPLADFQKQAFEEHRNEFDAQGKYCGTAGLRRVYVMLAAFAGAFFCAILGTIISGFLFRWPSLRIVLGSACGGAILFALVESWWHVLLRTSVKKQLNELPSGFRKRPCTLQFQTIDGPEMVRMSKILDLKGDVLDAKPYPVLYLQEKPSKVKFIADLELESTTDPMGGIRLQAGPALPRLLALVFAFLLACFGPVIATLFI